MKRFQFKIIVPSNNEYTYGSILYKMCTFIFYYWSLFICRNTFIMVRTKHTCLNMRVKIFFYDNEIIKHLVVSALRHVPKPGYGLAPRSHTFSTSGGSSVPQIPVSA